MPTLALLLALQATTPTLDGTIGPGEYDETMRRNGPDGLVVEFRATGEALYIAAHGTAGGFPHIAVTRGDTVLILHASAALGTARYAGSGTTHSLVTEFTWGVRNAGIGTAGDAAREQHYRQEGWTATTVEIGTPGVTEFRISRQLLPRDAPFAVAFWSQTRGVQRWPASTDDDAVAVRMVQGFLPGTATFTVNQWGRAP